MCLLAHLTNINAVGGSFHSFPRQRKRLLHNDIRSGQGAGGSLSHLAILRQLVLRDYPRVHRRQSKETQLRAYRFLRVLHLHISFHDGDIGH